MLKSLKEMLGLGPSTDYKQLVQAGAVIVDVRTRGEFASGHIPQSINIPVDQLADQLHRLRDKHQTIITCCASGMRSGSAKRILESNGYTKVHNGGGWSSLQYKMK